MGRALEVITGFTTAAGAAFTALTMSAGDSLTIRGTDPNKKSWLLSAWSDHQAVGIIRVRSPRMHDNNRGIVLSSAIGNPTPLLPVFVGTPVYPNDTMTVEQTGSAVAGDIETTALLLLYEDIPGIDQRLITADEVERRLKNIAGVLNTLGTLGAAGGWSGAEAINSDSDFLKGGVDYAILGYVLDAEVAAVAFRGPDSGNLRIGGPGNAINQQLTSEWFLRLSRLIGEPCVPVINWTNRAATFVDGAKDENALTPNVAWVVAELA